MERGLSDSTCTSNANGRQQQMTALVVFDVGNTLIRSEAPGLVTTLLNRTQVERTTALSIVAELHRRPTSQRLLDAVCRELGLRKISLQSYESPPVEICDGADRMLREVFSVAKIVTLSNTTSADSQALPAALARFISASYQSFRIGVAKPAKEAFEHVLRLEGVAPCKAVMVGDSYRADIDGAVQVGMSAIWVRRNAVIGQLESTHKQVSMVESLIETAARIKQWREALGKMS